MFVLGAKSVRILFQELGVSGVEAAAVRGAVEPGERRGRVRGRWGCGRGVSISL